MVVAPGGDEGDEDEGEDDSDTAYNCCSDGRDMTITGLMMAGDGVKIGTAG